MPDWNLHNRGSDERMGQAQKRSRMGPAEQDGEDVKKIPVGCIRRIRFTGTFLLTTYIYIIFIEIC